MRGRTMDQYGCFYGHLCTEGFSVHKMLTTYVRNEIAVNYHIKDAYLEMLS